MFFAPDSTYLYHYIESLRQNSVPWRSSLMFYQQAMSDMKIGDQNKMTGFMKAGLELTERLTRHYQKPEFGIESCVYKNKTTKVEQSIVLKNPFCNLLHFSKPEVKEKQPKLLMVAPMSGHHATLLRSTVQDTLPFFDVYVTDWIDANQVPITSGSFDLDAFIDYMINFMRFLGPDVHVMAVCQPTVPVIAAVAIMSDMQDTHIPKSMILMGGPIDARKNPTAPNDFANDKDLEWFDAMLVTQVPPNYPGHRRRVYPGFLQLLGFISMNVNRHAKSHMELFKSVMEGEDEKADKQRKFYDEFLSVMDLPAEFYLQTIKEVFHDFSLAKGKFVSRGRKVNLGAIEKCALMGIEGERDDIAAVGQTKAALNLCKNIPESKKDYYLQKDVGHYGVFSGSKFRDIIVPKIKDFVYANN